MAASIKSVRATLKIAAIYTFALFTAVACAKFEPAKTIVGTAKGDVVTPPPVAGPGGVAPAAVPPTELTVTITKVTATILGPEDNGIFAYIKIDMMHGAQPVSVNVFPEITPYVQDKTALPKVIGTVTYSGEGVCANEKCTKFGVMINVKDSKDGSDFQRVQIWDTEVKSAVPLHEFAGTVFSNITEAYETVTASQLNP